MRHYKRKTDWATVLDRLLARSKMIPCPNWPNMDDCLVWTGCRNNKGYGIITLRGHVKMRTHRAAWIEYYGPIPEDQWVLHKCDNPPCFRKEHLFLGTHADNVKDRDTKGRTYRPSLKSV